MLKQFFQSIASILVAAFCLGGCSQIGNPLVVSQGKDNQETALWLPSNGAKDIAVYENQYNAWLISHISVIDNGWEVYKYVSEYATGAGVRICGDNSDNCWLVNSLHNLYHFSNGVWTQLQGVQANDVACGADGSVWITNFSLDNQDGLVERFNGSSFVWYGGTGRAIAVDPNGNPWVANSLNDLYSLDVKTGTWTKQQGITARDVGISAYGSVWVISNEQNTSQPGNYNIYSLVNSTWQNMGEAGIAISVDPLGDAWIVKNNYTLEEYQNGLWIVHSENAHDVGISKNGEVWMISNNIAQGGYTVYQTHWKDMGIAGMRIKVSSTGDVWLVQTWDYLLKYHNGSWVKDQTIGAKDVGANGNSVWIISNKSAPSGGYKVYKLNGTSWQYMNGAGIAIDVDPSGNPWLVNSSNVLYKYSSGTWIQQNKTARDVGVGADGSVYIVSNELADSKGYKIYKLNLNGTSWQQIPNGSGTEISCDKDGNPWIVDSQGSVFQYVSGLWIRR
jgi:hypothetical protein